MTRSLKNLRSKSSKDSFQFVSRADREKRDMAPRKERLFLSDSRSPSPSPEEIEARKRDLSGANEDSHTLTNGVVPDSQRIFLNATDDTATEHEANKRSSYIHPSPDQIPKRGSSIRHSRKLSSSERKRLSKSYKLDGEPCKAAKTDVSVLSDGSFKTAEEEPTDQAETGVTRRIRELKEQKEERQRLSMSDSPDSAVEMSDSNFTSSPIETKELEEDKPHTDHMTNGVDPAIDVDKEELAAADEDQMDVDSELSAPPPTVRTAPLRIRTDVQRRSVSLGPSPLRPRHSPAVSRDEVRSASVAIPQRRNSSLLKRLSQPSSPLASEKQRRRLSNPPVPPIRTISNLASSGDSTADAVEDYITAPRLSQAVTNPETGRVISFSEVGDPEGSAVICCVGMGLTRYITAFYDELAATLKLRLITPDRPGVGGSDGHEDGQDTPLGWPDDVRCICEQLGITKFSILAHSAGAIYALATALRMPQHIRCRVHLLAPWIPPSQLSAIGTQQEPLPASALPYSQRVLRSLPTPFLKAANSSFFSVTSNSITTSLPRSPRKSKAKKQNQIPASTSNSPASKTPNGKLSDDSNPAEKENNPPSPLNRDTSSEEKFLASSEADLTSPPTDIDRTLASQGKDVEAGKTRDKEKSADYTNRLTTAIWDAATTNANSAIDLIVCLERRQSIGFRYVDITRAVVIHHGSKDTRVPVENVKWMGAAMRRCEVRVLEGEGHGLMASAAVMGGVLMEMSQEWEDWLRVVRGKRGLAGNGVASP